jgi:site-specific DNA-methyltransferase (adenine-specific)
MTVEIIHGKCELVLPTLEAESFHACVCDPPYHLHSIVKRFANSPRSEATENVLTPHGRTGRGFMGSTWDGGDIAFRPETWAEVWRVLKPGAYLVAFASCRGYHRMVCAIEDAGFWIHPMLGWIFGSGFPKAHDLSKAIDRAAGVERDIVAPPPYTRGRANGAYSDTRRVSYDYDPLPITAPTTEFAHQWQGWAYGLQSLKPAIEPICLAQKPFAETTSDEIHAVTGWDHWCSSRSDGEDVVVTRRALHPGVRSCRVRLSKDGQELAREDLGEYRPFVIGNGTANVLRHGTGALNIDASRVLVSAGDRRSYGVNGDEGPPTLGVYGERERVAYERSPQGRWPANCCHDGSPEVMAAFARFGESKSSGGCGEASQRTALNGTVYEGGWAGTTLGQNAGGLGDTGTAARFFFCAKADASERVGNHPTVKPIALMEWLVRLVTPPGGRVLDPFCGTGSTLVACDRLGFDAVGIEQDAQTVADAHEKIQRMRARRAIGDAERMTVSPNQMALPL